FGMGSECATMTDRSLFSCVAVLTAAGLALVATVDQSAAADESIVQQQIGPDPVLPEPDPGLLADMKIAEVVGWADGEAPDVSDGLVITPYAKDLANP